MGGVGAKLTAWQDAGAAFSLLAHNPPPNKNAVDINRTTGFRASRMAESPECNSSDVAALTASFIRVRPWNCPSDQRAIMK
jgi:hypothetical protein